MAKKETKEKTAARTLKVVGGQGKKDNGNSDGDVVDFASVRALARIATEFDLEEIEVNGAGHLRVRRAVVREVGAMDGIGGAASSAPSASSRPIALTPPVEAKGEVGTFVSSPFLTRISSTRPSDSDSISFISFIASTMQTTWPLRTAWPTSTNEGASGDGAR